MRGKCYDTYVIHKALTFRLYPTRCQAFKIDKALDLHRELYNAALQERRDAWKRCGVSVSRYEQQAQIKFIWKDRPDFKEFVGAKSAHDAIIRLDLAFRAFFRRVKNGEKPGYPRFKNKRSFNSFSITAAEGTRNYSVDEDVISIPKIGRIHWQPWCVFPGKAKRITIKRLADGYFATVVFECFDPAPLPKTNKSVGIDLGMLSVVATSDGEIIPAQKLILLCAAQGILLWW